MDTDTLNDAAEYAARIAEEVAALDAVLAGVEGIHVLDGYDHDDGDPAAWYLNNALSVEVLRSDMSEYRARVEITRTVGGPGCWIIYDTGEAADVVEVRAVWGSDDESRRVRVPHFCASVRDFCGVAW